MSIVWHATLFFALALYLVEQSCCAQLDHPGPHKVPNVTLTGYLPVKNSEGAALFYTYYEAQQPPADLPIIVWLQGGPGCASQFGSLYELGPQLVTDDLTLEPNPGTWNRKAALLFIDQPVGTGFSTAGKQGIPENEMEMAADLYVGLQRFFKLHPHLARRPVVIAGESYAGKYVPSIGHFVLQQQMLAHPAPGASLPGGRPSAGSSHSAGGLRAAREVREELLHGREELLQAPFFTLAGLVIGNGLTDPAAQVGTHADVAHAMGLLDERQKEAASIMQARVQSLIANAQWDAAHVARGEVLSYIADASGAATLLDVRRAEDYDAHKNVDAFLNQDHIKAALGVPPELQFESCSERVGAALGRDVMQSVVHLLPDLLDFLPVLLYQGQYRP